MENNSRKNLNANNGYEGRFQGFARWENCINYKDLNLSVERCFFL